MRASQRHHSLLLSLAVAALATAHGRRIKVQHLSPFLGRHQGGLLINVTGQGVLHAHACLPAYFRSAAYFKISSSLNACRGSCLLAAGFVVATNPKCRFGAMEVVATVRSHTAMQCYTPVNTDFNPDTVSLYNKQDKMLEISLNGVDWTNSKRTFTYYDHARVQVSLFEPQGGPLAGGTQLLIHGSSFRASEHLKCSWDGNTNPALKVDATYINYHTLKCITPPIQAGGTHALEIALDDYHFTNSSRLWTYYDPSQFIVSAVDPIGGPVSGGTNLTILGQGFMELGGQKQHGSPSLPSGNPDAHRRIDAGVFCKFSFDAVRGLRGQDFGCAEADHYDGLLDAAAYPAEGAAALSRASTSRHLRNHSCFTASTTPSLGKISSVVQATFGDGGRVYCMSPRFSGVLRDNRAVMRVHITLNGDFHDLAHLSLSNATYVVYDPREARIHSLERTGGPINGSTYVIIYGKLFYDFTLRDQSGQPWQGSNHHLQCRFGAAGITQATWYDRHRVACHSPRIHGFGHRQTVGVDVTFNGQDFLNGPNPTFIYSPLDAYSQEGQCRDAFGAAAPGMCMNNFTGIAVSELQPFGGPASGATQVVVIGRLFAVQGPSIMCKFGNLTMNAATFINDTAITCASPPNPGVNGTFENHFLEVTLNDEPNFLTASRVPFVYYNHNATLAVSAIYPRAGPKTGGNTITVYGSGFRVLGGKLVRPCDGVNLTSSTSEQLYGVERTEGTLSRGTDKGIGDSRTCAAPTLEGTNRGLQCLFGNMPPVHAYLLELDGSDPTSPLDPAVKSADKRVGTALICELPPLLPDVPKPHVPLDNERGLLPGSPYSVCVEITLNGNRTQSTDNCIEFTYYDT